MCSQEMGILMAHSQCIQSEIASHIHPQGM